MTSNAAASSNSPKPTRGPTRRTTQLGFNEFAEAVPDSRLISGADEVLRGSYIAAKNLSPEQIIEKLQHGSVVILRPSWRGETPLFLLLAVAVLLAIWLTVINPAAFIGILPMYSFAPLAVFAAILHKRYNNKYVLSDTHVTTATGFFGWTYLRLKIEYSKLKAVEVEKDLVQRVLNVGTVRLSTAMFDQPEVKLKRLYNPQYYASIVKIMQRMAQAAEAGKPIPNFEDGILVNEAL